MKVEVRLYATLRKYGKPDGTPTVFDIPEGALLSDVMACMGIPNDIEAVILINGRPATRTSVLSEGDKVVFFPPVTGG